MSKGDAVVGAQRFVERARGLNPHKRVQVGEALIVEGLRGLRRGRDDLVCTPDPVAQLNRPLHESGQAA
jgi:hypothetical protein